VASAGYDNEHDPNPVATGLVTSHGQRRLPLARGDARGPGWSLAAQLGFFVVTLDAVIVNVALPEIRQDLAGGMSGLQWVVDGYFARRHGQLGRRPGDRIAAAESDRAAAKFSGHRLHFRHLGTPAHVLGGAIGAPT